MLLVMFRSGGNLYAVDARRVVEVVPRVALRPVPHASIWMLGLLSYRGRIVPMIDFGALTGAPAARDVLSTRAIVANSIGLDGAPALVGLVAEDVSRVKTVEEAKVLKPGPRRGAAPYLGAVLRLDEGLVQLVDVDRLPFEDAAITESG